MTARILEFVVAIDPEGRDRILHQHFGDEGIRTICLEASDLNGANAYTIAAKLNAAYDSGKNHAFEQLRQLIGVQ